MAMGHFHYCQLLFVEYTKNLHNTRILDHDINVTINYVHTGAPFFTLRKKKRESAICLKISQLYLRIIKKMEIKSTLIHSNSLHCYN